MAQAKKAGTSAPRAATKKKKTADSAKRPYRREIWSAVCLFLCIFSALGYFSTEGAFIEFFCGGLKGLIGYGFWIMPPSLLACAYILAFHRGRPVRFRIACALLVPLAFGAFWQVAFGKTDYAISAGMFKQLWADGMNMSSGGAVAGFFASLFSFLFSKIGAGLILLLATVFCLLITFNRTVADIVNRIKNRERLEYVPEPEPEPRKAAYKQSEEQNKPVFKDERKIKKVVPATNAAAARPNIDIPIDDPIMEKPASDRRRPLFNSRPGTKTPAEIIEPAQPQEPEAPPAAPAEPLVQPGPDMPAIKAEQTAAAVKPQDTVTQKTDESARMSKEEEAAFEVDEKQITAPAPPEYEFPPLSLLAAEKTGGRIDGREEVRLNKERLETSLQSFGINSPITGIIRGPSVTRYETELEAGVKLNKLTNLSDDIALNLGASSVRIAAIPNKVNTVGIEVPNKLISKVYLREIIDSPEFKNASSKLTFALGKNISGEAIVGNISKLPHMLVAGTTGSGKSVCLNSLILSILYKARPDEVKFIMVDPKMVEFKIYNGIPHLLVPVVTEAKKAAGALQWAVFEMMKRYRLFSDSGARDIASYNEIVKKTGEAEPIPQLVVVIDELADLMLVAAKEVEESVCRVAQMGRAAGVHLVIATQSPRADVITGLMKANIPSRIALKVSSALESRIILDSGGGAEKLVGYGDMLYAPMGTPKPMRIQGTWVTDQERESIVEFVKKSGEAQYSDEVMSQIEKAAADKGGASDQKQEDKSPDDEYDELFPQAVDVVLDSGQASVSMLQRRLKLGYSRAARLVDQMEEHGIVGPFEGSKPRQLLITKTQWQEMQYIHGTAPIESPEDVQTADSGDTAE